jgi:hypothetical protein
MQSVIRSDVNTERECPIVDTLHGDIGNTNTTIKKRRTTRKCTRLRIKRVVKEILANQPQVMRLSQCAVALLQKEGESMLHGKFIAVKSREYTGVPTLPEMKLVYELTRIEGPPSRIRLLDALESMPNENNNNENDNHNDNDNRFEIDG